MKNLNFTFVQRLKVSNILGQVSGNLEKILPLSNALEVIRFSEEEQRQIKITPNGGGIVSYEAPTPDFGTKAITLEDAQAQAVLRELESFQGYQVMDVAWLTDLKTKLGG